MALAGYEWRNIRNRLLSFGRAVQGVSPYRVILEPDISKCPSGNTNFSHRIITVNPTMFDVSPEDQYTLTKAVLGHEAGHRRFTTPSRLPPNVHFVSNILEDERIERLMEQEFAGVRPLLKLLSGQLLREAPPLDSESDDPAQVLNYILQLRWSERTGLPAKGTLSPFNWECWVEVEPLAREAWMADSSQVCDRNAQEIVRILGIREPDIPEWLKKLLEKLEALEGERRSGDPAEKMTPVTERPLTEDDGHGVPFDGEPVPHEYRAGTDGHEIEPRPYLEIIEKVRPLVARLVEELTTERYVSSFEPSERRGRLSVRQHLREPGRPFMSPQDKVPALPTLTFRLVIDHSTSMNYQGRIEYAAQAATMLHLAALELGVHHQIVIAPNNLRIADLESGELGLAMIAGIIPAQTGWEDTGLAVSRHGSELAEMAEDLKLLVVIHDGMGNDHELLTKECRRLRDRVLILGLGIGMGETEAALLKEQFGSDRYIQCASPEELPEKVGAILRSVRRV